MKPKEIIEGLMAKAQDFYGQTAAEYVDGVACVAYNPEEDIIEPGVFLTPPESFVTLPIRDFNSPQYNIETARPILYPQIRTKVNA